jgi:hypothetical protein
MVTQQANWLQGQSREHCEQTQSKNWMKQGQSRELCEQTQSKNWMKQD